MRRHPLGDILIEAGVPPEIFHVVTGRGSRIGDYLVEHDGLDMITFTGSSQIGRSLAKRAGMMPLMLELGGKDAAIVLGDADLDNAAADIVSGAYAYSGQRCTAVKRVLVVGHQRSEFRRHQRDHLTVFVDPQRPLLHRHLADQHHRGQSAGTSGPSG